jgi:hypothetical protein
MTRWTINVIAFVLGWSTARVFQMSGIDVVVTVLLAVTYFWMVSADREVSSAPLCPWAETRRR